MLSPFRIVIFFIAIALCGWLILPRLKIDLLPPERSPVLTVSFTLPNSSPDIVEQQVTAVIEGACSQLSQLKNINSTSRYNYGYVELQFDRSADMEFKQFELAAIIRQIYTTLPTGCSYPVIVKHSQEDAAQSPLLIYSINAQVQPLLIKQEAENVFQKAFAGIPGIKETRISGAENLQLTILFDKTKCEAWQIKPSQFIYAIQAAFTSSWPGYIIKGNGEQYFLKVSSANSSVENIEQILITVPGKQDIHLKDIAKVYLEEKEPQSYFRINGKNSVNLSVFAREDENKIVLGKKAKELIKKVQELLPKGFEVSLDYDDTDFLEKEINKNYRRAGLSACILIVFILLAYRSWKHLINLLSGLVISLCFTLILAWFFRVNIHIYTIAGLSISFSIMIDNAIVMLDYYWQWQSRKIFLALLASSLITIAAVCMVFFLPEEEKKNLVDFSIIIILSLIASLITALVFIPGCYMLLHASSPQKKYSVASRSTFAGKWKRVLAKGYYRTISFIAGYRKTFIVLLILAFGLPLFMLPAKWEGNSWYQRLYNSSFGSEFYKEHIKSKADKWLGGSLRSFAGNMNERSGYRSPEKTKLYVNAGLPYGNTTAQMNYILSSFERYLSSIEGIDKYITTVRSGQSGSIEISFKKGFENSVLPFQLKSKLISRSLDWGGVEWNIYGIGQAFTNAGANETPGFLVLMKGYNYDKLEKLANLLAEKLRKHKRIQKVNINERLDYVEKQSKEYVLNLDPKQMSLYHTDNNEVAEKLNVITKPAGNIGEILLDDRYYPLVLKEKDAEAYSDYDLLHNSLQLDTGKIIRVDELGKLELINTANSIHKEDRQYIRVIAFEYMGSEQFGTQYLEKVLKEMKEEMPAGYTAERENWNWQWGKTNRNYILISMLIVAIFFICSILFENLQAPFFIITMIPISFIGLFLTFSWGGFYFDQGGYAAFIMLGGLVSNAAIFIVNDFNNLKKKRPGASYNRLLIKAAINRSRTILLTIISTCCGLTPFLTEGQNEPFWFSLAAGTIGGLVFSLFAVFIVLPVFLWKKSSKKAQLTRHQ